MRIDVTGTTVERAIALAERLNRQKGISVAMEMAGDKVVLSETDISAMPLSRLSVK